MANRPVVTFGNSGDKCFSVESSRVNASRKFEVRLNHHHHIRALPGNSKQLLPKTIHTRAHTHTHTRDHSHKTIPIHTMFQHNVRGLKSDSALTELIDSFRCISGFSLGLQETWRYGKEIFEEDGCTFLGSGPDIQRGRGSCGVGLFLSHAATLAWQVASPDNLYNDFGSRDISAKMLVTYPN
jgi:hypothetical protein